MKARVPTVRKIMRQFNLTLKQVSARANCSLVDTYKALDLRYFTRCPLLTVTQVRQGLEAELKRRRWKGRRKELWNEYDAALKRLVKNNAKKAFSR